MAQSSEINELVTALAKARTKIQHPTRSREGQVGNKRYKYADLAALCDAVVPALSEVGVAVIQAPEMDPARGMLLRTVVAHTSGQWIDSTYELLNGARPQDMGSAITYARRYALSALLCVASEDDDDGAAAQSAPPTQRRSSQQTSKPAGDDPMPVDEALAWIADKLLSAEKTAPVVKEWLGKRDRSALVAHIEQAYSNNPRCEALDKLTLADRRLVTEEAMARIRTNLKEREEAGGDDDGAPF